MKALQLQPRLQMLARLVPQGAALADVGTDHGYLPVYLLQEGRIRRAIASDVSAEPLEHARRTAEEYGVTSIDFRLCDGLSLIKPHETDTVVIAGMGGETMVSILSAAPWTKDGALLLLQPMTRQELLRSWLAEHGYTYEREVLVRDKGTIYPIFQMRGGTRRPLTEAESYAGVALRSDPLYGDYLDHQLDRLQKQIDGLLRSGSEKNRSRAEELTAICNELRRIRRTL